nr:MAG TPA: hypothetical protein [Caudoviricetes sp.]
MQFSKIYRFSSSFGASGFRHGLFKGRLYTVFPPVSLPGECRHVRGLSLYGSGYQDAAFQFSFIRCPGGCLSTFYTIYRVFPLRKNLTYLLGFCLFILKDEVLAAAFPFIYLIMYIFVKPSFLCICTHE